MPKDGNKALNVSLDGHLVTIAKKYFANAPRDKGLSATVARLLRRELQSKGIRVPVLTK